MNHIQPPSEFVEILSVHSNVFQFVQHVSSSTQTRPEARRAFLRKQANAKLRVEPSDFKSPLGICRYFTEIASAQSNAIHPFFTRFVTPQNLSLQWLNGLYLGPDGFQELLAQHYNEAARLVRSRMDSCYKARKKYMDWIEQALSDLGVEKFVRTISTVADLEAYAVRKPDGARTAIFENLSDVLRELEVFVRQCPDKILCKSIDRKMKKIQTVVEGLQTVPVDVLLTTATTNITTATTTVDETNTVPMKEYERLCGLLEKHKIDYVEVPSDSLQEVQAYIQKQEVLQQKFVRVLFTDDSSDRDKFEAENEIERIQKNLDTAQRRQFEFQEFLEAQQGLLAETFRPKIEAAREKYVSLVTQLNLDRSVPKNQLAYRVRSKLFADSDVGPFVSSTSASRFWWSVIDNNMVQTEQILKMQEVRKAIGQVWESKDPQKLGIGCLFYFHIPYDMVKSVGGGDLVYAWMQFVLYAVSLKIIPTTTLKPNNFMHGC